MIFWQRVAWALGAARALRGVAQGYLAVIFLPDLHRLLECPAASFSWSRASPDTRRTEEAFVDLDHANKLGFFLSLVNMDQGLEDPEIAIDGLPVQSQQLGGFRRIDVDAKTGDNFLTR